MKSGLFTEGRQFARDHVSVSRALGDTNDQRILGNLRLAEILIKDPSSSFADFVEAEAILANQLPIQRRIYGPNHPETLCTVSQLDTVRDILALKRKLLSRGHRGI